MVLIRHPRNDRDGICELEDHNEAEKEKLLRKLKGCLRLLLPQLELVLFVHLCQPCGLGTQHRKGNFQKRKGTK